MQYKLTIFLLLAIGFVFSQSEADKWVVRPNALIDFSGLIPSLSTISTDVLFTESGSCISDRNGNLLFYSDGETVWGADGNELPNGSDLSSVFWNTMLTTTQGSIFVNKPHNENQYYLLSLAANGVLSYSVLDRTLNNGLGDVVSKQNILIGDKLTEKMAVTKHCNNKNYWLVVVKIKYKSIDPPVYSLEFLSYLISEYGIHASPIRSNVEAECSLLGQMKFNNAGNELAFADGSTLVLCHFDSSSGAVILKDKINLPLENGYGIEYAPNDSIIYVNEKQYNLYSQTLTPLLGFSSPTQLQRAIDGKIYRYHYPKNEILGFIDSGLSANNWQLSPNADSISHIASIEFPNLAGMACNYIPNAITINHPGIPKNYINLPYIAAYHFNHKPSDFSYTSACPNAPVDFYLENGYNDIDSVNWTVPELGLNAQGDTVSFSFPHAGEWTVEAVAFQNGVATKSIQCINICGKESLQLPEYIDLCEQEPFEINPISTCGISYSWNTGDTTSAVFIKDEGLYILEMVTECGIYLDTITVEKSESCTVFTEIPNIITANNDGINDLFAINYKNAVSFSYVIVNRWGNILKQGQVTVPPPSVFEWNSASLWDGTAQSGADGTDGTYYYRITFETFDGSKIEKSGFLEVVH
jgi:hypothetical protein